MFDLFFWREREDYGQEEWNGSVCDCGRVRLFPNLNIVTA